jgi:hypothetical protein
MVSAEGKERMIAALTFREVLTNLVLFADAAHKTYSEKLGTMLFRYDFTDLMSTVSVVTDLQSRLRHVVEVERLQRRHLQGMGDAGRIEALKQKAQALSLAQELNLIFDAIKSAQDKVDDHSDRKSAVLLRASSNDITWRMLDQQRDLLAKLALSKIEFTWLSRADSSTVSKLVLGDLQAFAGSQKAVWSEILSKSEEPANHPLVKVSSTCLEGLHHAHALLACMLPSRGLGSTPSCWRNLGVRKADCATPPITPPT